MILLGTREISEFGRKADEGCDDTEGSLVQLSSADSFVSTAGRRRLNVTPHRPAAQVDALSGVSYAGLSVYGIQPLARRKMDLLKQILKYLLRKDLNFH